jgi:hypothetical protein
LRFYLILESTRCLLLHQFLTFTFALGDGGPIHIYDGRRSLTESKTEATLSSSGNSQKTDSGEGEIIYFRDSDDEMPDSDEDPDDDLDI